MGIRTGPRWAGGFYIFGASISVQLLAFHYFGDQNLGDSNNMIISPRPKPKIVQIFCQKVGIYIFRNPIYHKNIGFSKKNPRKCGVGVGGMFVTSIL